MKSLALDLCLSFTLAVSHPAAGSEIALPAGTNVSVKLADAIDSARDGFARQYAASVTTPVELAGSPAIPAGSRATVVLVHNNTGWLTQLSTLTINGRKVDVASSAGALIDPEQGTTANSTGILARMGISVSNAPAPTLRVQLPAATELRFVLIGAAKPARPVVTTVHARSSARANTAPAILAASEQQEAGIAYLCSARDRSGLPAPSSYYIAEVFETLDKPALVERRWYEYLAATYPYRFANNPHATVQCMRIEDSVARRNARKNLIGELKSENAEIIETRWHYTIGPPPAPAAATTAPAAR